MSLPIRLESVSKCYRIFGSPRDRLKQALLDRLRGVAGPRADRALYREHWALRDVSLALRPGEAVGIIGRNGAGKSTLLQIIAGTLEPTSGAVETQGRITALLELGSGFNPEFTGRENVFLNGQVLGLSRQEVRGRFDDIEAFADIGDFIDQPVKTFSSGMVMRLAFAVQTVLDPDILIVDEALSVGDAKFQEKCFRKLRALREDGTTILFVSHDINAVTSFCDRAILLESGGVKASGASLDVAKAYIESLYGGQAAPGGDGGGLAPGMPVAKGPGPSGAQGDNRFGNRKVEILRVEIRDESGRATEVLSSGGRYTISQTIVAREAVKDIATGFIIRNKRGIDLFGITNKTAGTDIAQVLPGQCLEISVDVGMWLAAGDYFLQAANAGEDGVQYDCRFDALHFTVVGTPGLFTSSIVNLDPVFRVSAVDLGDAPAGDSGPQDFRPT